MLYDAVMSGGASVQAVNATGSLNRGRYQAVPTDTQPSTPLLKRPCCRNILKSLLGLFIVAAIIAWIKATSSQFIGTCLVQTPALDRHTMMPVAGLGDGRLLSELERFSLQQDSSFFGDQSSNLSPIETVAVESEETPSHAQRHLRLAKSKISERDRLMIRVKLEYWGMPDNLIEFMFRAIEEAPQRFILDYSASHDGKKSRHLIGIRRQYGLHVSLEEITNNYNGRPIKRKRYDIYPWNPVELVKPPNNMDARVAFARDMLDSGSTCSSTRDMVSYINWWTHSLHTHIHVPGGYRRDVRCQRQMSWATMCLMTDNDRHGHRASDFVTTDFTSPEIFGPTDLSRTATLNVSNIGEFDDLPRKKQLEARAVREILIHRERVSEEGYPLMRMVYLNDGEKGNFTIFQDDKFGGGKVRIFLEKVPPNDEHRGYYKAHREFIDNKGMCVKRDNIEKFTAYHIIEQYDHTGKSKQFQWNPFS